MVWPYVRARLFRLCERFQQDWIPEDVYSACATGKATLHPIIEDGSMTGFFVLEQTQEFGIASLHVWVMSHEGDGDVYPPVFEKIKEYAGRVKADRVRFSTQRDGWYRKLQQYGWKETARYLELGLWQAAAEQTR